MAHKLNPQREKFHGLYWNIAFAAAAESKAKRKQVGAVIVAPTGMISIGFNGMPSGHDGPCEHQTITENGIVRVTRPEVIHAERNAIDKMTRQGVSTEGSIMFTTLAPCMECAKSIYGLGFAAVHYWEPYGEDGINFLISSGVEIVCADVADLAV